MIKLNVIPKLAVISIISVCIAFAGQKTKDSSVTNSKDTSIHADKPAVKAAEKQILFFMNPNGHPCQMQLSIIEGMKSKLEGVATVTFIKTTEPSDENKFYQYGIRGLPSLIIADNSGKEIKRLPPGIKDENAILEALK